MSIALWIVQLLLAAVFALAGVFKLTQSREKLIENGMDYVETMPAGAVPVIGALELLGAIGIVLPVLTGILPWLTPLAAGGLALTMVFASSLHLRRREFPNVGINVVLLLLALFVVYGRTALVA